MPTGLQTATWLWHGHSISTVCSPPVGAPTRPGVVVLVHGFGANWRHWRHTFPALSSAGFKVCALDLLGFGASDKPPSRLAGERTSQASVQYCFDLWAEQVADFSLSCQNSGPIQLVGNSIGGVVALNAARLLEQNGQPPSQVVLLNCAQRQLDSKRLAEQPVMQRWLRPLLMSTVRKRLLIHSLFRLLAQPAVVHRVLRQAYPSGHNVDAELIDLLLTPSREAGAKESFRGFVNLFDDHLAPELLAGLTLPVRMLWGEADPWEDVAEARRWANLYPCIQELQVLSGIGHCPHDEDPERVNPILVRWLTEESHGV